MYVSPSSYILVVLEVHNSGFLSLFRSEVVRLVNHYKGRFPFEHSAKLHFEIDILYPPQNEVLVGGYTVFQHVCDSVIPKANKFFFYNFNSVCPILIKFKLHLNDQTMQVW